MSDLLITINASSLKKNKFLILETYYTAKVEANKSGRFKGGSITPADLSNAMPVSNCDIKNICNLLNKQCYRLSNNGYYVSVESLKKLVLDLNENKMIFLDNNDKSLVLIEKIIKIRPRKKTKNSYKTDSISMEWYSDCSLYIEETASSIKPLKCEPTSKLQYSLKKSVYYLQFYYNGVAVEYMEKRPSIQFDDKTYLRNYSFETNVYETLMKENFTKLSGSKFAYSGHKNKIDLKNSLAIKNVVVSYDENMIIPKIKINRNKDGWFDIDLSYDNNGETFDLASKINLFSEDGTIEIAGETILLPESILRAREYLLLDENKLKLNQNHIFEILRIAYDSNNAIDDLFSYNDIKLNLSEEIKNTAFPYQINGIKWLKFLYLNNL